jgi:hypothetical protein
MKDYLVTIAGTWIGQGGFESVTEALDWATKTWALGTAVEIWDIDGNLAWLGSL